MGLNIGRLLYGIRTKYEMNVKDICRGICSPSSYCMYENGEIVPDILLVNMFLDRMGFGILGLTAYISEKECRLPRLLTQQGLTTIERVDDAG